MRLYIAYADAPSLSVVANHVAKVARRAGHEVFMRTYPDLMEFKMLKAEGLLYIYPVNPPMASRYAGFYSTQASYMPEESQLWYGTAEGTPMGPASVVPNVEDGTVRGELNVHRVEAPGGGLQGGRHSAPRL